MPVSFDRTLLIGLGGVGSKIVARTYSKFIAGNPSDVEKRNAIFLAMDTDGGDVKEVKNVLPKSWVIKTSANTQTSVAEYINSIHSKCQVEKWFDTRSKIVLDMSLDKGAGQVRMTSRLALMSAINEGKLNAIDNSIDQLLANEPERAIGNTMNIGIVCSIAGGTGAGSFLQVAYYVKKLLREKYDINAPYISGYFILPEILCNDVEIGFSNSQKENTRSNAYACMKELNAFMHYDQYPDLDFEFMFGMEDTKLPKYRPYDQCYLIDYSGQEGTNLTHADVYYNQVAQFLFLNSFSEVGDEYRSNAINDVRQRIEDDGNNSFSTIGVSSIEYPMEDLFDYFSNRRLKENLSNTWLRIDKDFEARMAEYKKNLYDGIADVEPRIDEFFKSNVENIANNGSGFEKTEFRNIYESTQELNEDRMPIGSKAQSFIEKVKGYVETSYSSNDNLKILYEQCTEELANFLDGVDLTADISQIDKRERSIKDLTAYSAKLVDMLKNGCIKQCLLADDDEDGKVSKDAVATQHRLNTYILAKDNEMHPLAVRYFLYDVKMNLESAIAEMTKQNESDAKAIADYKNAFNVVPEKGIDDYTESASENLQYYYNKSAFGREKRVIQKKEDYNRISKQQAELVYEHGKNQLLEYVFQGLLYQVKILIEESESFFKRLVYTIDHLGSKVNIMEAQHEGLIDPSKMFVLASAQIKDQIFVNEITATASPFFPNDLSKELYVNLFSAACKTIDKNKKKTLQLTDDQKKMKEEELVKANNVLFDRVATNQKDTLKRSNGTYVSMNIIEALIEEAKLYNRDSRKEQISYLKDKIDTMMRKTLFLGANDINGTRFINAWGFNKCIVESLTEAEADEVFGLTDVQANPETAATRLGNGFFSPYEIIRANSANLLTLENNFKGFWNRPSTNLVSGFKGWYFNAYESVLNKMKGKDSKTYSVHLDKTWHLPTRMANIGVDMSDNMVKVYKAFYQGLLFGRFIIKEQDGCSYWYSMGNPGGFIKDSQGFKIKAKLFGSLSDLLEKGLLYSPQYVDQVLVYSYRQWEEAREEWNQTDCEESEKMNKLKNLDIVKKIKEFKFTQWPTYSIFDLPKKINSQTFLGKNMNVLMHQVYNDIIDHVILLNGRNVNSMELCKYIFGSISDEGEKVVALGIVENKEEDGAFEEKQAES